MIVARSDTLSTTGREVDITTHISPARELTSRKESVRPNWSDAEFSINIPIHAAHQGPTIHMDSRVRLTPVPRNILKHESSTLVKSNDNMLLDLNHEEVGYLIHRRCTQTILDEDHTDDVGDSARPKRH